MQPGTEEVSLQRAAALTLGPGALLPSDWFGFLTSTLNTDAAPQPVIKSAGFSIHVICRHVPRFRARLELSVNTALSSFPALNECLTSIFLIAPLRCLCVCGVQDQRLKEIGMQTPPSASPSSQAMNSANNNHIAQTPELFPSSLSANRYAPSHSTAVSLHCGRI